MWLYERSKTSAGGAVLRCNFVPDAGNWGLTGAWVMANKASRCDELRTLRLSAIGP